MAVPLPNIHLPEFNLPPPPANPPTNQDVLDARIMCQTVDDRQRITSLNAVAAQGPSATDVAAAHLYFHKILNAVVAADQEIHAAPVNLQNLIGPIQQQLNDIQQQQAQAAQQFNQMQQQFNHMQQQQVQQFAQINVGLVNLLETSYQAYNRGCEDGVHMPFKVIPIRLPDGAVRQPQELDLPVLTSIHSITALPDDHLNRYLQLYNIPHAENLQRSTKIDRLKAFIGSIGAAHGM